MKKSCTIWSEGTRLAADLFVPDGLAPGERRPAVLLCHGWGGVKEHLSATYAPWFCKAGLVALTFDYRGWGESESKLLLEGKQPDPGADGLVDVRARLIREVVDPFDQLLDIAHCLDFLDGEPSVDAERIGIWGSSYGGGHAVFTGAHDPRIKAIVAQVGAQRPMGSDEFEKLARDRARARARGEIEPVPQAQDAVAGLGGTPDIAKMARYRAIDSAHLIRVPTLVIDAEEEELFDRMQNGHAVYEIVRENAPAAYHAYPCKHYAIYDQYYRPASTLARDWFAKHLGLGGAA